MSDNPAPIPLRQTALDGGIDALDGRGFRPFKSACDEVSSGRKTPQQMRRQFDGRCSADIGHDQIDASRANRVSRTREQGDINSRAAHVLGGDLHRDRIEIASDYSPRAQQRRSDGENRRAGPDIEHRHARLLILLERFETELCRFVESGPARQARIDLDPNTSCRSRVVTPFWNQVEASADSDRLPTSSRKLDPITRGMAFELSAESPHKTGAIGPGVEKRPQQPAAVGQIVLDDAGRTVLPKFGDEQVPSFIVRFHFE